MFSRKIDLLLLLLVCFAAFWWRLGALGLIDPDEPFYSQTAREMVSSGDWLTPRIYGQPQFEKPIFYYWLVAGSFVTLGESEFAGRAPATLFSTLLVLLVWAFGTRVWNARTGFLAALVMATGLEYCVMSRLMLTDIPLAFFMAGSVFAAWLARKEEDKRDLWTFVHLTCAGLAVLTKGPIGGMVPVFASIAFSRGMKRPIFFTGRGFWWGIAAYAVIVLPWYGLMFAEHARQFWDEFFVRDNIMRMFRAEHPANNHWWYYPGLLLLGSLPWMPAVALTVRRAFRGIRQDEATYFQWCWLLTSLVFLSLAQSKLPSYAFYLFVPLALIVARTLDDVLEKGFATNGERWLVIGFAIFQCVAALGAPMIKVARAFGTPVMMLSACLAVSLIFLLLKRHKAWLLTSATASLALLAGALTTTLPAVEAESSAKPVAMAILRERQGDEPILTGVFLTRGIIYYTKLPVSVVARKAQPFWAAHPLPVVLWSKGLKQMMTEKPTAICALRKSEWNSLNDLDCFKGREAFVEMGENVLVRARGEVVAPKTVTKE